MRRVYVEVSTLFEPGWSGIANVAANLCRVLLRADRDIKFFAYDKILAHEFVMNAVQIRDGAGLRLMFEYEVAVEAHLRARDKSRSEVAIFPNFKRVGQDFEHELLIVHDLSFILCPELHEPRRVADYLEKIYRDAHEMDRCICVSNATRQDLATYYGVAESKIIVSHLGVDRSQIVLADQKTESRILEELSLASEKFFLMLGTIEPRKNIALVLDYIKNNPEVLESYKFVFAGRNGWGKTFSQLLQERDLFDTRLIHLGYITEHLRQLLLRNCKALVFPSLFEGFGLPVVEAMSWGTPVLGSYSSSIAEVGGPQMLSFDPMSLESFSVCLEGFMAMSPEALSALKVRSKTWASQFTWEKFCDGILAAIDSLNMSPRKRVEYKPRSVAGRYC